MTIQELIDELWLFKDDAVIKNVDLSDYGSDRGDYSCFYIGEGEIKKHTAKEIVEFLYSIDGQIFTGYKGGEFLMTLDTPIRLGGYGCCGSDIEGVFIDFDGEAYIAKEEGK